MKPARDVYDLNPLFAQGITGTGQTIAVIEDTNLYNSADWDTFRTTFGLAQYTSGSLTTLQPAPMGGANNCANPQDVRGGGKGVLVQSGPALRHQCGDH